MKRTRQVGICGCVPLVELLCTGSVREESGEHDVDQIGPCKEDEEDRGEKDCCEQSTKQLPSACGDCPCEDPGQHASNTGFYPDTDSGSRQFYSWIKEVKEKMCCIGPVEREVPDRIGCSGDKVDNGRKECKGPGEDHQLQQFSEIIPGKQMHEPHESGHREDIGGGKMEEECSRWKEHSGRSGLHQIPGHDGGHEECQQTPRSNLDRGDPVNESPYDVGRVHSRFHPGGGEMKISRAGILSGTADSQSSPQRSSMVERRAL